LIDSHCHLYADQFTEDLEEMMNRALDAGVERFYLPAIDSATTGSMLALEQKYPGNCYAMMGLHPCSVNENVEKELSLVEDWLDKRKFAAVGEIGLDLYWDKTFIAQQYMAFRRQTEWAINHSLPIVIHSREAIDECIAVVQEYKGRVKGIFHCFGGSLDEAKQIIDLGFLLGIGGVVTYKKSGLDHVLKDIDLQYLVLETDAPYLSPVPFRGKRNESSYLKYVCDKIAEIKQVSPDEIAAITTTNALRIFEVI
jgi:TatD DNase family protein